MLFENLHLINKNPPPGGVLPVLSEGPGPVERGVHGPHEHSSGGPSEGGTPGGLVPSVRQEGDPAGSLLISMHYRSVESIIRSHEVPDTVFPSGTTVARVCTRTRTPPPCLLSLMSRVGAVEAGSHMEAD